MGREKRFAKLVAVSVGLWRHLAATCHRTGAWAVEP